MLTPRSQMAGAAGTPRARRRGTRLDPELEGRVTTNLLLARTTNLLLARITVDAAMVMHTANAARSRSQQRARELATTPSAHAVHGSYEHHDPRAQTT